MNTGEGTGGNELANPADPDSQEDMEAYPRIMRAMRGGPTVRPCFQDCHGIGGSHLPKKGKACIEIDGIIEI